MYIPYKVIISHTSLLNNHLRVVEDEQTEDNKPDIDLSLKTQLLQFKKVWDVVIIANNICSLNISLIEDKWSGKGMVLPANIYY